VPRAATIGDGSTIDVRCACIDIGSNTTRLLVAEADAAAPGRLREVESHRAFMRLSTRERRDGLSPDKAEAMAEVVAEQALAARAAGVAALRIVATAGLRHARGRGALLARLGTAAGCPVEVLSPEEEARLAFAGATAGLAADGRPVAVIDVGGGSTELVRGTPGGEIGWWASVPLGSGALAERFLHGDPPTGAELRAARDHARAVLDAAGCERTDQAWTVGGSATSLGRVVGPVLTADALDDALRRVCARPAAESALAMDLHVERVRLLPAGLVLLSAAARAFGCPVRVAAGGLREGVVLDLLARVG
jgi:exopolyphosphatase/guanosine-5'-triphosphate,3'-diphosphate pyrophosphatase